MPNLKSWRSRQLQRLKLDSDRMFNQVCSELGLPSVCKPLMDADLVLTETEEGYRIEANLPGVSTEHLELSIDGAHLTLRCTYDEQCGSSEVAGSFESQIRLPCKVRLEDVEATLNNDMLVIKLPSCKRLDRRVIPITSGEHEK